MAQQLFGNALYYSEVNKLFEREKKQLKIAEDLAKKLIENIAQLNDEVNKSKAEFEKNPMREPTTKEINKKEKLNNLYNKTLNELKSLNEMV